VLDLTDLTTDENCSDFDARCELMLDVTCRTLEEDPELLLCEGLRLIEATRKAVSRIAPESAAVFDAEVLPRMRNILMTRFGLSELPAGPIN
jgi:hypothetical protein